MSRAKKHYDFNVEETEIDYEKKIITMIQFARKAGQIVYGFEATKKNIINGKIKLLLLTKDISQNTKDKIMKLMESVENVLPVKEYSTQEDLSIALGLPWTCIIGILDNNFAGKILNYINSN